jgi:hypothetical protein
VKKRKEIELDFKIDKFTNSIENSRTGEIFETEVTRLFSKDSKQIKKADWDFDWHKEYKNPTNEVYKLTTINKPTIIQGLICFTDKHDHIFMSLIESSKFNKGTHKLYKGVAGNLVAYGCKVSFERGYDGVVSFVAKSQLIEHYRQTLGAKLFGGSSRMFIDTREALSLVKQYFKDFNHGKLKKNRRPRFCFCEQTFDGKGRESIQRLSESPQVKAEAKTNLANGIPNKEGVGITQPTFLSFLRRQESFYSIRTQDSSIRRNDLREKFSIRTPVFRSHHIGLTWKNFGCQHPMHLLISVGTAIGKNRDGIIFIRRFSQGR